MNIQVDGYTVRRIFGSYKVTVGKKTHETNNFELMLKFIAKESKQLEQDERFERSLDVMPQGEYENLLNRPSDSCNEDYSGEVHEGEKFVINQEN